MPAFNPPDIDRRELLDSGHMIVSQVVPFCSFLLSSIACVLAVVRIYVLDWALPKRYPRLYHKDNKDFTAAQRRSFLNHHVALITKVILALFALYPLLSILWGHATVQTPWFPGCIATMGDVMVGCTQFFTVMYVFELFYRDKISFISCAHHVGAILIAQWALWNTVSSEHEEPATYEFVLCHVWGAFDVFAEALPHVVMILHRVRSTDHRLLWKWFLAIMILELTSTVIETIAVMFLYVRLWGYWPLGLKVGTICLHLLFSVAQVYGAKVYGALARQHYDKMKDRKAETTVELNIVVHVA